MKISKLSDINEKITEHVLFEKEIRRESFCKSLKRTL